MTRRSWAILLTLVALEAALCYGIARCGLNAPAAPLAAVAHAPAQDTYVDPWRPDASYDAAPELVLRAGGGSTVALIDIGAPARALTLYPLGRSNSQWIDLEAREVLVPWDAGLTWSIWLGSEQAALSQTVLDRARVGELYQPVTLSLHGARRVALIARAGGNVQYVFASREHADSAQRPDALLDEGLTPPPLPSATPRAPSPLPENPPCTAAPTAVMPTETATWAALPTATTQPTASATATRDPSPPPTEPAPPAPPALLGCERLQSMTITVQQGGHVVVAVQCAGGE